VKLGFKLEGAQHAIGREKRLDNKQTLHNNKILERERQPKRAATN
jgi:hypothetical protein